jgi:hypothetical protein
MGLGDLPGAAESLEQSVRLDGSDTAGLLLLAFILLQRLAFVRKR